jgi:hypothetical protein
MPTLKSQVEELANRFAAGVLAAVRGASLEELLGSGPAKKGPGRPPRAAAAAAPKTPKKKSGRLARRSPSDIERVVGLIVGTLREHKAGLRSEQLQKVLKLDKREITGPIAAALGAKKITKRGQKRSTTYFAK